MRTPTAEESRRYIDGRIERLKTQKIIASWVSILAVIAFGIGVAQDGWSLFIAVGLMAVGFLTGSAVRALCDLHIDALTFQRRDLDRDEANGLFDFEQQV